MSQVKHRLCPFCGSKDVYEDFVEGRYKEFCICNSCGASAPISRWDNRVTVEKED